MKTQVIAIAALMMMTALSPIFAKEGDSEAREHEPLDPSDIPVTGVHENSNGHLFYVPTPWMPAEGTIVLSLHELSYVFPYRLQIHGSILDNIGRLNLAVKYNIFKMLAVGVGMGHSFIHIGPGCHGIPPGATPRVGAYLVFGLNTDHFDFNIVPHTQLGDHFSAGVDVGFHIQPNPVWGIIIEAGSSYDFTDQLLYGNLDGGIRFRIDKVPGLSFDLGVDLEEFNVTDWEIGGATVYFDVQYKMRITPKNERG